MKTFFIGLGAVLLLLIVIIAKQPDEFKVTRTATIHALPVVVFSQVNDLQNWERWSPWAKLDPNATTTFEGPRAGEGAAMAWDGNMDIGKGRLEITESIPHQSVQYRLDFEKPMAGTSTSEFSLKPEGQQTFVTWSMQGKNNFMAKAMSLVMDCEEMVGTQFEQGLQNLKTVSEGMEVN